MLSGGKKPQPRRNVTDPDSRLLPVRGGGFTQGCNCQDAAADDRLMLGGYACQDTGDVLQGQRLAQVAEGGAAVVADAHAAHAAGHALLAECHGRLCTLPDKEKNDPGHDAAACRHAMTSRIGVLAEDAGYHSEANLAAPGPDRLIADGKTRDLAAQAAPTFTLHDPADHGPRRNCAESSTGNSAAGCSNSEGCNNLRGLRISAPPWGHSRSPGARAPESPRVCGGSQSAGE